MESAVYGPIAFVIGFVMVITGGSTLFAAQGEAFSKGDYNSKIALGTILLILGIAMLYFTWDPVYTYFFGSPPETILH